MKRYFPFIFLLSNLCFSFAQNKDIDSLLTLLKTDKADTTKVIHLNKLSNQYRNLGSYDTALYYANEALVNTEKLNTPYKKGVAVAYTNFGNAYVDQGNYEKALDYYIKVLKMVEAWGDKKEIASTLGNIGVVYFNQGNFLKTLDYYFKALKIAEEIGSKKDIARHLANIGNVYMYEGEYQKSLDYDFKALKIAEEMNMKGGVASVLGNIGNIYYYKANYPKALDYYAKVLKMMDELGDRDGKSSILGNMGAIYADMKNYTDALTYLSEALKIKEEIGDKNSAALWLDNIGSVYITQNKYKDAFAKLYRALAIDDSIGSKDNLKEVYYHLSTLYEKSNIALPDSLGGKILSMEGMRLRALYYHKRFVAVRDTLFSEDSKKQLMRKEMNYEFDKKELAVKAEQDKKDALAAEAKQKQQIFSILVSCILILVIVFSVFMYKRFKITQKQKQVIEEQKVLVDEAYDSLHEKNKEVMDSILYARRIQQALITPEKYIENALKKLMRK